MRDSRMPLSMAAYFANGGRRAYVVRVAPADAVVGTALIPSEEQDFTVFAGDGVDVSLDSVTGDGLEPVVVPSSVSIRWRSTGTPVVAQAMLTRAGAALLADGAAVRYEARAALVGATYDRVLPVIDPDATLRIGWTTGAAPATPINLTVANPGDMIATGSNVGGSSAVVDLSSGLVTMDFDALEVPDITTSLNLSYTPTTARLLTDDGAGALAGTGGTGTVNYETGAWTATASAAPIGDYPVLADYSRGLWLVRAISPGAWASDMKIRVSGNVDYYTASTATYSKYDVAVLMLNSATGNYNVVELFEEIDFDDAESAQYFPDVLNDLSDYVRVDEPALDATAPAQIAGRARQQVIAAGSAAAPAQTITVTLRDFPVEPRTLSITYTDSTAVARTVTDDGSGNLIGNVDGSGTNTIVYATGVINVRVSHPIGVLGFVTVSYRLASGEIVDEVFGDEDKQFTAGAVTYYEVGTNGTYDSVNFGRDQFTSPVLQPLYEGIYALDRVEDLLQVVLPDFAGDTLLTGDMLDYVDGRANLPAGGDRFAILSVPRASSAQDAVNYFRYDLGRFSKFAALYWPWVKVADPLRDNRSVVFPPVAHIAGIYARTDSTKNVGKSPGGTVDGALRFITGIELVSSQGERDLVYPNKINPIISSPQTGTAVWGVRTIAQESEWRYINARRVFMFVERSVYNSTFWVVFENNGPTLWARIKAQLDSFLLGLYNEGLFAGSTPSQAFFVRVDETNNDASSISAGQVIIDVGIAPTTPAEFVRFRFQQKTLSS